MTIKTMNFGLISLLAVGFAAAASAHDLNFKTISGANGAEATDVWEIECSGDATLGPSASLSAQIRELTPNSSNKLSLVIYKDGKAQTTTDLVAGDAGYSPLISVAAGNGVYSVIVNHTQSGNKAYSITYHCENASGDHTPTTVPSSPVQDQ